MTSGSLPGLRHTSRKSKLFRAEKCARNFFPMLPVAPVMRIVLLMRAAPSSVVPPRAFDLLEGEPLGFRHAQQNEQEAGHADRSIGPERSRGAQPAVQNWECECQDKTGHP